MAPPALCGPRVRQIYHCCSTSHARTGRCCCNPRDARCCAALLRARPCCMKAIEYTWSYLAAIDRIRGHAASRADRRTDRRNAAGHGQTCTVTHASPTGPGPAARRRRGLERATKRLGPDTAPAARQCRRLRGRRRCLPAGPRAPSSSGVRQRRAVVRGVPVAHQRAQRVVVRLRQPPAEGRACLRRCSGEHQPAPRSHLRPLQRCFGFLGGGGGGAQLYKPTLGRSH
jgi:hypothetical protein